MKSKFYFFTWLYSLLFNILLVGIGLLGVPVLQEHRLLSGFELSDKLEELCLVGGFSLLFSVPGIMTLVAAVYFSEFFLNPRQRFVFIIVAGMVGTLASYFLLLVIAQINMFDYSPVFILISFAAVLVALLINRKLFYKAFIPSYLIK